MIVAGFGFNTSASLDSLLDALAQTEATPDLLATLEDKAHLLAPLARHLNLPLRKITHPETSGQHTPTDSAASRAHRGTGSVAEATALAAAGPGAHLLVSRRISTDRRATCAIAESPTP